MAEDVLLNNDYTYTSAPSTAPPVISTTVITGGTAPVTTINGNSGIANGPVVTLTGGVTGYSFTGAGSTLTLTVANAATVRTAISAAKSGTNADITNFTGLNSNTGFAAWTGGSDGSTHATFSGTASVAYVQAELQAVMDSLKQATEFIKKLVDAGLATGTIEN